MTNTEEEKYNLYIVDYPLEGKGEILTGAECLNKYGEVRFYDIKKGYVPSVTAREIPTL